MCYSWEGKSDPKRPRRLLSPPPLMSTSNPARPTLPPIHSAQTESRPQDANMNSQIFPVRRYLPDNLGHAEFTEGSYSHAYQYDSYRQLPPMALYDQPHPHHTYQDERYHPVSSSPHPINQTQSRPPLNTSYRPSDDRRHSYDTFVSATQAPADYYPESRIHHTSHRDLEYLPASGAHVDDQFQPVTPDVPGQYFQGVSPTTGPDWTAYQESPRLPAPVYADDIESGGDQGSGTTETGSAVKKKRKRADAAQLSILNAVYARTAFPSTEERRSLAEQLEMTPRSVQIWFQNKRQANRVPKSPASSGPGTHAAALVVPPPPLQSIGDFHRRTSRTSIYSSDPSPSGTSHSVESDYELSNSPTTPFHPPPFSDVSKTTPPLPLGNRQAELSRSNGHKDDYFQNRRR